MVIFILFQFNHIFIIFIIMTTITLFKYCSRKCCTEAYSLHWGMQSCTEALNLARRQAVLLWGLKSCTEECNPALRHAILHGGKQSCTEVHNLALRHAILQWEVKSCTEAKFLALMQMHAILHWGMQYCTEAYNLALRRKTLFDPLTHWCTEMARTITLTAQFQKLVYKEARKALITTGLHMAGPCGWE